MKIKVTNHYLFTLMLVGTLSLSSSFVEAMQQPVDQGWWASLWRNVTGAAQTTWSYANAPLQTAGNTVTNFTSNLARDWSKYTQNVNFARATGRVVGQAAGGIVEGYKKATAKSSNNVSEGVVQAPNNANLTEREARDDGTRQSGRVIGRFTRGFVEGYNETNAPAAGGAANNVPARVVPGSTIGAAERARAAEIFADDLANLSIGNPPRTPVADPVTGIIPPPTGLYGIVRGATNAAVREAGQVFMQEVVNPTVHKVGLDSKSSFFEKCLLYGVGLIASYFVIRYAYHKIEGYLNGPSLDFKMIEPDHAIDTTNLFKDLVFEADTRDRLNKIILSTVEFKRKIMDGEEVNYRNLLIYGPEGSGKEIFVKELAQAAHMRYYEVSNDALKDALSKDPKAIETFFKNEVSNSQEGAIVFIKINEKSEAEIRNILALFPGIIKNRSNVYMLVFSCLTKPEMPRALGLMIDVVGVKHPELPERIKILSMTRDRLFPEQGLNENRALLSDNKISTIAQRLVKASASGLVDFIINLKNKGTLSPELIDQELNAATENNEYLV